MPRAPRRPSTPAEELRAAAWGVAGVVRSAPRLTAALLVVTVLQGAAPAMVIAGTGHFLAVLPDAMRDGAASAAGRDVRATLLLVAGAVFASQVLGPVQQAVLFGVQRRFEAYLGRRLMTAAVSLPGLAYFEDPEFSDELHVAGWIGYGPVHTLQFVMQLVQQVSQVFAMAVVAATFAGWVPAVVVAAAAPAAVAAWRFESITGMARWRGSPDVRRADYYRNLAVLREPGKELRVFGLASWAVGRHQGHWLAAVRELWAARRRSVLVALGLQALGFSVAAVTYAVMLRATAAGAAEVGTFTAASLAAVGLHGSIAGVSRQAAQARRSSYYLPAARRLDMLARTEPRLDVRGTRSARGLPRRGLRFEAVSFRYPGATRDVIDGLDLEVAAGTSLALVGENGAGKTTLIKLLCRFYDPTRGRILLDGVDLRELDLAGLRSRLAVVFQDFVRYELPARDNVGFGAIDRLTDDVLLREAAVRAGALELLEHLPDGWDTPLAREFGGVDLSGGEWQRVALARAMAAQLGRPADLLVLDEPTASLDVRVEHELYERFANITRDCTTLLVSHRFSTVRMAERIVLLEGGRVVEDGSHDELMAARGRYAALYEAQASHYRLTGKLE